MQRAWCVFQITQILRTAFIERPRVSELGIDAFGSINGRDFGAEDFQESALISLGAPTSFGCEGIPRPGPKFIGSNGIFLSSNRYQCPTLSGMMCLAYKVLCSVQTVGSREELPAAIAQEIHTRLGTTIHKPFVLHGRITNEGSPINSYNPLQLKNLFVGNSYTPFGTLKNWTRYTNKQLIRFTRDSEKMARRSK